MSSRLTLRALPRAAREAASHRFVTLRLARHGAGLAALLCTVHAYAQSEVTVYGRINTALEYSWIAGADHAAARETNNRSVWGLRGTESLGGSLKAVWQIENNFNINDGKGGIATRNSRIGLQGEYGLLFLGNWHTPYTEATMAWDPFYPTTAGYMALIGNGSASTDNNVSNTAAFDRRQQNTVQYRSPQWRGMSVSLGYGMAESRDVAPARPALYSAAARYVQGPVEATAAYEVHQHYHAADRNDDAWKVGLAWQIAAGTRLAVLFEHLHYRTDTGDLQRSGYYASLTQKLGPGSVQLGFAIASNGSGTATDTIGTLRSGSATGATQLTIGYDYPLSKRTALFAYYSRIDNRRNAAYDFAINGIGVSSGQDPQTLAIGMRHSF